MTDWRHVTTARPWLGGPRAEDVTDLHRIHGDPVNWAHFPQGRHVDVARTMETVAQSVVQWVNPARSWWQRAGRARDGAEGRHLDPDLRSPIDR